MITPFFTIDQNDEFVFIDVKITHMRFNALELEMIVDQELFIFSLSPYYLRIRLPFACVDDERSHAEFDSKTECIKIKIPKENKGQFFPDLDLSAKLLARSEAPEPLLTEVGEKKPSSGGQLIQELDVNNDISQKTTLEQDIAEGEKFNWEVNQTVPEALEDSARLTSIKYGFNDQYDAIIGVSTAKGNDINELGDPETTAPDDRIIERLIKENIKFDLEYYAADYIMEKYPSADDDKTFSQLLEWKSPTTKLFMKWYKSQQELPPDSRNGVMPVGFSKEEQERMLDLPRKSFLIEPSHQPQLMMLIVSLLFSYHFDMRETEGDHNIESAWTVGKLTPQISFLDAKFIIPSESTKENILRVAIITSIRRALSYPYHRNYKLISKVWDDVYYNLRGGKRLVLKSLLDLKELFRFHDIYYVYDKIWLQDLCAWIIGDGISEGTIRHLAHDVKKQVETVKKSDITFEKVGNDVDMTSDNDEIMAINLEEIEQMAEQSYAEYQQS